MEELQSDPDIIKKKVNEKIMLILAKYGYTYEITEFAWVNGQIQATIDIVKIPENITEK